MVDIDDIDRKILQALQQDGRITNAEINISMERHRRSDIEAVRKAVQDMNEVLECHHVTGEFDYQLKVVVRNRAELEQFVLDRLSTIAGIAHIRTSLVFSEIKSTTRLDVKPSP